MGAKRFPSSEDLDDLFGVSPENRRKCGPQEADRKRVQAGIEYRQIKVRAAEGRFDGTLNSKAAEGWRVLSIDRVDELFLVTFQRPVRQPVREVTETVQVATTNSAGYGEFADEVREKSRAGWDLKHVVTSVVPMGVVHAVYYTAVWERTTQGRSR